MRAAHGAKMSGLGALLWQSFIVKFPRRLGVEREVELVFPAKFKTRLAQRVVAILRAGMALGQIGGVGRNLVSDDAILDVLLVRQSQMFLGRDVTKHRAAAPADHGGADSAGDVIV